MSTEPPKDEEKNKVVVFQLNDELAEFEELEFNRAEVKLYELLDPKFILLFLNPARFKCYIWQGSESSTRMRFISAKLAAPIRDKHGVAMKIVTADDGNEPLDFKIMVGLAEEIEYKQEESKPTYTGTQEDMELLNLASLDKILLILEKAGLPDGFKRDLVIVKNKIYRYIVMDKEYMGQVIEEKQLLPLQEQVPDGSYIAEGYIPRMLFSFNNIVLLELLKKMTAEELAVQKAKEERMLQQMQAQA